MQDPREYADLAPIFMRYRVERASIFGSRARGDAHAGSDYDFLVDFAPDASMLDWGGLFEELSAHYGCSVDVVSRGALEDDVFTSRIMRDARLIYEND